MKNLIIVCLCIIPFLGIAQVDETSQSDRFRSSDKQYNDWSLFGFGGTALIQTGDLTSIKNGVGDWNFGYDFEVGIEKAINHAFGLMFQYHQGKTKQEYIGGFYPGGVGLTGETEYQGFMILGDINLTSIFRRFDNQSKYKWRLSSYLGAGLIGYKASSNAMNRFLDIGNDTEMIVVDDESAGLGSFYAGAGLGLYYRISRRVDLGIKGMYYFTGDEEFDGSGDPVFIGGYNVFSAADIEEQRRDNFVTLSLGLEVKLGKHNEHLFWVPFVPAPPAPAAEPLCESGDEDQDGVCDDWDKCLDTPLGARIDGSGCALDTDLDGIIDLYDKCVTEPGPAETQGCPPVIEIEDDVNAMFEGIEFALDSDELRPVSIPYLNNAAEVIKRYGEGREFYVEGYTDTRASEEYNLDLSQRRCNTVVEYLVAQGVDRAQLIPIGKGETNLLYPECQDADKCKRDGNEWKNEANRRVVFRLKDNELRTYPSDNEPNTTDYQQGEEVMEEVNN